MCQRLNTGESNNFYFGIFICIGHLNMTCVMFKLYYMLYYRLCNFNDYINKLYFWNNQ